jgi:hypothetical protein
VEVLGPIKVDTTWQAQAGKGFDVSDFTIDWENQRVTCPNGQTSQVWADSQDKAGHPRIYSPVCQGQLPGLSSAHRLYPLD